MHAEQQCPPCRMDVVSRPCTILLQKQRQDKEGRDTSMGRTQSVVNVRCSSIEPVVAAAVSSMAGPLLQLSK